MSRKKNLEAVKAELKRRQQPCMSPTVPHAEADAFDLMIQAGEALLKAQGAGRASRALSIAKTHLETAMLWVEADLELKHRALGTELPFPTALALGLACGCGISPDDDVGVTCRKHTPKPTAPAPSLWGRRR